MRGVLVLRNSFMLAVTLNLSCGIIRRKHTAISTGLMYLDCSGVTTENSAICVFFLIRYGDSVLLVCLTETLLSNTVDIEWEISRLAVSVNFSTGVTVPVVFHYEGWLTEAVIVFAVLGGIVKASSVRAVWGLAVVSLERVLTCIFKCGNCMRPCVVSMTTLLFLINCNPMIGPVNFFITTKRWKNVLSPISNVGVVVANGFLNGHLLLVFEKLESRRFCEFHSGPFVLLCPSDSGQLQQHSSWVYQGIYC